MTDQRNGSENSTKPKDEQPDLISSTPAQTLVLPDSPHIEGHDFVGWKVDESGALYQPGEEIIVMSDLHFVGEWTEVTWAVITFTNLQGARLISEYTNPLKAIIDRIYILPHAERSGYKLRGWSLNSSMNEFLQPGEGILISGNISFQASWASNSGGGGGGGTSAN